MYERPISKLICISCSSTTKVLWEKICDRRLAYVMICAIWVLPVLISLPKSFESDVEFIAGRRNGTGTTICYLREGGNVTLFSDVQYFINVGNDVSVFLVIVACYVLIYCDFRRFRRLHRQSREELGNVNTETHLDNFERHVEALDKRLCISIGLIYVCFVVLR